jgi:hypothetical protein
LGCISNESAKNLQQGLSTVDNGEYDDLDR